MLDQTYERAPRPAELIAIGIFAAVVAALPIDALMTAQNLLDGRGMGAVPGWALFALSAIPIGAVLGPVVGHRPHGLAAAASGGLLTGLLGWMVWYLTVEPLLRGTRPTWSAAAAGATYRELVGELLLGGLAGLLCHRLAALRAASADATGAPGGRAAVPPVAASGTGPDSDRGPGVAGVGGAAHQAVVEGGGRPGPSGAGGLGTVRRSDGMGSGRAGGVPRVVIVGGGFGGVSAAQRFERLALRGLRVDVTIVSDSNFLLFTPMLAEVASGALEAQHISAPVRAAAAHTRFRRGVVEDLDTETRTVSVATGGDEPEVLPYDHLVMAVGAVPYFLDLPGMAEHAFTLKSLADAALLRDHVLALLERADLEADPAQRARQLTFVVAGGGFAGTETAAELFDLVHGVLHYYPGIHPDEPRFVLIHSRPAILPELSTELGEYALERLRARGIEFRLGVRAAGVDADGVLIGDGERIETATFVWTAGNRPSPLTALLPGERGRGGAIITDAAFRAVGVDRVWAIGDCAQIPDLAAGDDHYFPPTAQHAMREGKAVADNIAAVLRGRKPKAFHFQTIGIFVALGHRTAAGEIRGRRFSGLAAWFLWRGIYLAKLPGIEKRVRVLFDWALELAFPRDIVVTAPPPRPAVKKVQESA